MPKVKKQDVYFECRIAGVSFLNDDGSSRQNALALLANVFHENAEAFGEPETRPNITLVLKREPENPYDANAVGVYAKLERGLHQLGHIPRGHAEVLAPIMDAGQPTPCELLSIGQAQGGKKLWGASIRVSWTEELV